MAFLTVQEVKKVMIINPTKRVRDLTLLKLFRKLLLIYFIEGVEIADVTIQTTSKLTNRKQDA